MRLMHDTALKFQSERKGKRHFLYFKYIISAVLCIKNIFGRLFEVSEVQT